MLQGFPTLLFFPAEKDAEPIAYDGGRTLGVSNRHEMSRADWLVD